MPENTRPDLPLTREGGCHCGQVRYRFTLRDWRLRECNCSICAKKAQLHLTVAAADFQLLSDPDALATYSFLTHTAKHHFCRHCGVHSFYVPRSHPDGFSVNARCVDGIELAWFERSTFDGQHWEANVHAIR